MARSLNASCTSCGYSASVELGGVRSNFLTTFLYPHICRDCKEIFSGSLYLEPCRCSECGSANTLSYESRKARRFRRSDDQVVAEYYMTTELVQEPVPFTPVVAMPVKKVGFWGWLHRILGRGEAVIPSPRERRKSRRVTILNNGYLCPKCAETKLEFSVFAFVD